MYLKIFATDFIFRQLHMVKENLADTKKLLTEFMPLDMQQNAIDQSKNNITCWTEFSLWPIKSLIINLNRNIVI